MVRVRQVVDTAYAKAAKVYTQTQRDSDTKQRERETQREVLYYRY